MTPAGVVGETVTIQTLDRAVASPNSLARRVTNVRALVALSALGFVLVAAILRFAELATLPQGLFHDEAYDVIDEATISWSNLPVFFPANTGREALFLYWQKLFLTGLGVSVFSAHLASAAVGVATVALQFAVIRRLFGNRTALLSTFVLATLQWHVQFSRISFRAVLLPIFVLLLVLSLWWVTRRRHVAPLILAGVAMGLAANSYAAGFALPLLAAAYFAYLIFSRRWEWRRWLAGFAVASLVCAALLTPLAFYVVAHPESLVRLRQTTAIHESTSLSTDVQAVMHNVGAYAESFIARGDPNPEWAVNIPGDPVFDAPVALLCYVGVFVLIGLVVRPRLFGADSRARDAAVLCLLTLLVMYLPGILAKDAPYYPRTVGALPVVALAPALGADWLMRLTRRWRLWLVASAVVGAASSYQVLSTVHDYFGTWAHSPSVAASFASGAEEIARFVEVAHPSGPLFISSANFPSVQALAPETVRTARWFDATEIVPMPTGDSRDAWYLFDADHASLLENVVAQSAVPVLSGRDRNANVEVARGYRLAAGSQFPVFANANPVAFGSRLELTPIAVQPDPNEPGAMAVVLGITSLVQSPGYLSLSVRLVDSAGQTWGQKDGLGDDLTHWQAGQRAITLHRLHVYSGAPPGSLTAEVQVYDLTSMRPLARDDGLGSTLGFGGSIVPAQGLGDPVAPPAPRLRAIVPAAVSGALRVQGVGVSTGAPTQGDLVSIDLLWSCRFQSAPGARLDVEVSDQHGHVALASPPAGGLTAPPPDGCMANRPYLDRRVLQLDSRWPTGLSTFHAVLRGPDNSVMARISMTTIDVLPLSRGMTVPVLDHVYHTAFADGISLEGLSIIPSVNGTRLTVRLVWRTTAPPARGFTVFAHLLDSNGKLVAQHDGIPANGKWPTTAWEAGQVVIDDHEVVLDSSARTLEVGLYDTLTGARLPVIQSGTIPTADHAIRVPLSP